jgi:hypothetical protein
MKYIQLKSYGQLETVDQFETMKEARAMLREYIISGGGEYYISGRACHDWHNKEEAKNKSAKPNK